MEQKIYKKSLIINDISNENYSKYFDLLKNCMFDSLKKNEENLCFFKGSLKYSDRAVNAMELKFEWSSNPNQPDSSKRED